MKKITCIRPSILAMALLFYWWPGIVLPTARADESDAVLPQLQGASAHPTMMDDTFAGQEEEESSTPALLLLDAVVAPCHQNEDADGAVTSEEAYPNQNNSGGGEGEEDKWGVGFHPIIGYGPESSLVLGVGAAFYYNSRPYDPGQRLDEYSLNLTYSLNEQGSISLDGAKYFNGNEHILNVSLELTNTPAPFYGIGPNTLQTDREEYTQQGTAMTVAWLTEIIPGLHIGPQYDLFLSEITHANGPQLNSGQILGSNTAHESGIGFMVTYDTTNANLYKLTGTRLDLRTNLYHHLLSSSHAFSRTEFAIRQYFSLGGRFVLGLNAAIKSTYGDVPFFYLPRLGSNKLLRGYSSDRYMANHFAGAQAELRFPLFWRLGGAAFVGVGEVTNEMANWGNYVRGAGGLGFRVALNKKQTINLRFDLAYNSDGELEKYIKLREAF